MQLYPAIDIRDGRCVRLIQGDYDRETVFASDPVQMAQRWQSEGASGLHLVDLDGARDGTTCNLKPIEGIVQSIAIPCQLGGGIRNEQTIRTYLDIGINRLVVGTKAITDPQWLTEMTRKFPNKLLIGIDARDNRIATDGWKKTSSHSPLEFVAAMNDLPIAGVIYTDISRDGMLAGPNFKIMEQIRKIARVPLIASGGVTTVEDIVRLMSIGADGCIIGLALYEGKISLSEAIVTVEKQSSAS